MVESGFSIGSLTRAKFGISKVIGDESAIGYTEEWLGESQQVKSTIKYKRWIKKGKGGVFTAQHDNFYGLFGTKEFNNVYSAKHEYYLERKEGEGLRGMAKKVKTAVEIPAHSLSESKLSLTTGFQVNNLISTEFSLST